MIPQISEPIGWDWVELADLIDESRRRLGGILITRRVQVGRHQLSVAACFGAHCEPGHDNPNGHEDRALRDYTHVEIAVIGASDEDFSKIIEGIDIEWDDRIAGYVEVSKLPILINSMLRVSSRRGIQVPAEDVPAILAHFNAVLAESKTIDPFKSGQYGEGGPGTHGYFSFSD